ncbi:MAG: adenylate/guanylate cyclase domain-containing protein [Saprospiraceae bacterium]|nr:adenylate/guanylate cyclase domain-containing protein [Saprospiraceae bacterium]
MLNKRRFVNEWLLSVMAWIAIVYFYALLTVFGFKGYFEQNPITEYMYSGFFHLEVVLTGVILGTLFTAVNRVTDFSVIRTKPFGLIIFIKSILYILSLVLCTIIIYQIFYRLHIVTQEDFQFFQDYLFNIRYMASILSYFFFFIFLINFISQINRKFGPGVLFDLLRGKYYHPRKEHLIFLFIDLKSSTAIAERLGHEKYSQFIRECVHELTPVLIKNEANVYQYVGDEVVLHWKTEEGLDQLKCLDTYFEFKRRLDERRLYFQNKYGLFPEFKAGMDTGEVTVTEIGDIKREIAFHGDVLNTASRLEKKCNEYERWLLVTENLIERFKGISSAIAYQFEFLNDIPLRGKHERLKFFAVNHP